MAAHLLYWARPFQAGRTDMSLAELMPTLQNLPRHDKLEVVRCLMSDLTRAEGVDSLLHNGASYTVWTPFDIFMLANRCNRCLIRTWCHDDSGQRNLSVPTDRFGGRTVGLHAASSISIGAATWEMNFQAATAELFQRIRSDRHVSS